METLEIEKQELDGGWACLLLAGTVNTKTLDILSEALDALRKEKRFLVKMDFSQVAYVSTAGVDLLLEAFSWIRRNGGDMVLVAVPRYLREVFDTLGVGSLLRMEDDISSIALEPWRATKPPVVG